jgi:hypothetical protein
MHAPTITIHAQASRGWSRSSDNQGSTSEGEAMIERILSGCFLRTPMTFRGSGDRAAARQTVHAARPLHATHEEASACQTSARLGKLWRSF